SPMNRLRPLLIIVAIIAAAVVLWLLLSGSKRERMLSGYIEGEELYLASPVAGTVASVSAVEGTRVAPGQQLFTIDPATLVAQRAEAEATRDEAAEAQGGQREPRIRRNQLAPTAPAAGRIEDVYLQRGEWVNANQAVVALRPDNKVKVRFYVPEQQVAAYTPG